MNKFHPLLIALILGISLIAMGYFIQNGLINLRGNSRNVEVKGLAERNVIADIAVWNLSYEITDSNLAEARRQLADNEKIIREFLISHGVKSENIKAERLSVYTRQEQDVRVGDVTQFKTVYAISQTIEASSTDVRTIEKATQDTASLIEQGIILRPSNPRYLFTRLNEIKPEMIAEATRAAREAADRFATDSNSTVGPILRASQGWFNILPRMGGEYGEENMIEKKVRVITTIDFMLVD